MPCINCGLAGHNIRTCKTLITHEFEKNKKGKNN